MNRTDYVLTRKANGDTRALAEIAAEFDALAASLVPPAPDAAALAAAVKRSDAVNAWLSLQKPGKPGEGASAADLAAWEELRRLPFEQLSEQLSKRAGL